MTGLVIDTQVLMVLSEVEDAGQLPLVALDGLDVADRVVLSTASIFEFNQKVRIGKLQATPIDAPQFRLLEEDGIDILPLTAPLMAHAASLRWIHKGRSHRDPFDRMIAATALSLEMPVVASDTAFDALGIERIWT